MPISFVSKYFSLLFYFAIMLGSPMELKAQLSQEDNEAFYIRKIYDETLTQGASYDWLTYLTKKIGARLSGSPAAAAAVEYTRQVMDTLGLDTVWLQPCMVPRWVRGEPEQVRIVNSKKIGTVELKGCALGNSIGTGPNGITAPVIEVKSLDEVDSLGREHIEGKIVFYNRPMDPRNINTFRAYGGAVDQRGAGAERAAQHGALAVIVRSMTTRLDDIPHTGSMSYKEGIDSIPALAISTNDAELLSRVLQEETVSVFIRNTSRILDPVLSYNVIGEIRGSEFPEEIIAIGGHLDSWDIGEGAHDDGTGCVQSLEVMHIIRRLGYRPKRTIRCIMFMNEENGLVGGRTYAKWSNQMEEFHMAAIESDRGGFAPRGFSCEGDESIFSEKLQLVSQWLPLLEPYGLTLTVGGSGADISPLKSQKGILFGLMPDTQRYFDYHHTAIDCLEAVNQRELEMGAAAMVSLVYLLDKYGLGY